MSSKISFINKESNEKGNKSINYIISKQIKKEEEEDLSEELEKEFEEELEKNMPSNYGNSWSDEERMIIINMLKKYEPKTNNILNEKIIGKISKKLERTDGGVRAEIKKIVFNKYLEGVEKEIISKELNISLSNVKLLIRLFLEKDSDQMINLLEKENKILHLSIENIRLKKELKKIKIVE
jgi:DNA-directed RNA polymerase specialized sigma24 family protein